MAIFLLAIDQGTTSTRAIVFNKSGVPVSQHQIEFKQYFPESGWVEHDPEEIWQATLQCCRHAVAMAGITFKDIAAIGITNQRETTVIWDRNTGVPIYHAIVWQDRRTASLCEALKELGHEDTVQSKTGCLLDSYFSATKITWILDQVPGARQRAESGELAFGTMDSFLLWRLTAGQQHATDISNASRTLLYNIHEQKWDDELLELFHVPYKLLPQVKDNCGEFGFTDPDLFGSAVPITGMAGDQQAALIGQTCFQPGMVKSTFGTGTFLVLNTGEKAVHSKNRLLTTIAYRIQGKITYAMEGSIFSSGSIVQWLRDQMKFIKEASESEALSASVETNGGVYLVPAFTGLGAPYWDPHARGAIEGLSRDTQPAHIVRAGLEAVAYQTRDLMEAMSADGAGGFKAMKVDGGMVVNNWLMQFLSNVLHLPVERPTVVETTALGAAYLAGLGIGVYSSLEEISQLWQCEKQFNPDMEEDQRNSLYKTWQEAVNRIVG